MSARLQRIERKWWWGIPLAPLGYLFHQRILWDEDCWSPNHEYYIVRKESPLSWAFSRVESKYGWFLVFDKTGRLLYRWDDDLNIHVGVPYSLGDSVVLTNVGHFDLPTDGGRDGTHRSCF